MVNVIKRPSIDKGIEIRYPCFVELVGPAGAGKTSLINALNHLDDRIQIISFPYYREIARVPFFTHNSILLLPTILRLRQAKKGRWLTPQEIAWMVILNGWHDLLPRQTLGKTLIAVLDQGPVFFLYWLYGFGPEVLQTTVAQKWWNKTIECWAKTLDVIVWLDATDNILMQRIRSRDMWHQVKDKPDQEIRSFLADSRAALDLVITALTEKDKDLKLLRIDTEQESPEEIAYHLFTSWGIITP